MLAQVALILMSVQAASAPVAAPAAPASVEERRLSNPIGPPEPPKSKPRAIAAPPAESCRNALPTEPGEIVVCAERPQGYRIDPDILQASRDKRNRRKLKRPDRMVDTSCQVVGPMGCMNGPAIDIVTATVAAATMLKKAVNGENVGKMFITTPEPSEYELYLEAKRRREAAEEELPPSTAAAATPAPK